MSDWQSWSLKEKEQLLQELLYDFDLWRLPHQQLPPDSEWRYYLNLSGRGASKLLNVDTPILTTNGFKKMQDISTDDTVFDENGDPTKVIHVSHIQNEQSYKLTFSDNSVLHAHEGHQWVTLTHAERKNYGERRKKYNLPPIPYNWANKESTTTQEIFDTLNVKKGTNHSIPITKPLNIPERDDLPLHPYLLGVLLGDGCSTIARIAGVDQEIFDHIENCGYKLTRHSDNTTNCMKYGVQHADGKSIRPQLRALNYFDNKHIPDIYKMSSYKQRLELLQGCLDSDGSFKPGSKREVIFTNTNERLARDVMFIAHSLGMRATIRSYKRDRYGEKTKDVFIVRIIALDHVFKLSRKAAQIDFSRDVPSYHNLLIKSIEKGPIIPMKCIMVDSPNSMYLAGTSLIPTHNTRFSSEEIRRRALQHPNTRINLIAPTHGDCRDTNIEGESGILSVCAPHEIKKYLKNNGQIIFNNGSRVLTFSAQEPERLRGKQSHYAFMDEFAAFDDTAEEILQQVQMSNRLGTDPKIYITTTPKPIKVLQDLIERPDTHLVVSGTLDNPFLATPQIRELVERYADTSIGQQELFGKILKESKNAKWTRAMIDDYRVTPDEVPSLTRVVIAVDPSKTGKRRSDEAGIIVAGRGSDNHYYILKDLSVRASPEQWIARLVASFRIPYFNTYPSLVVVENSDGELVRTLIRNADPNIPTRLIKHQKRGKITRADPAAQLYEQGKVHHVGYFAELEDQMTSKVDGDDSIHDDRYDALVYVLKELSATGSGGTFVSPHQRARTQARKRFR